MDGQLIGRVIHSRYKLIDERGSGGFGSVYIARDLQNNYLYAVKILHLDYAEDGEVLARFKREAAILEGLHDPHIVRLVDYGRDDDLYFIIMHHADGQNLKYYTLTHGPMEPLRALNYAEQVAEGLDAAFKRGVVHRDIKPQNILISNKHVVKIADFGLSRSVDMPTITHSDKFMGTVYYSAPEQIASGHAADIRSDLYSLAAVLFEMLTGHPPFEGRTAVEIIMKHEHDDVPSICQLRPDLPAEMDAFLQKAMAKSPTVRYQTPREFIAALRQVAQRLQGSVMPPPPDTVPQPRLLILTSRQTFLLHGAEMIVGREDPKREIRPDIQINDSTMTLGRQHARLLNRQGTWMLEDNNSRNKTRLNGVVLAPYEARALKDGDVIYFGRVEARFELR